MRRACATPGRMNTAQPTPIQATKEGSGHVPTLSADALLSLITDAANAAGLPVRLVAAVVRTESGGNPCAMRYEPDFDKRYNRQKPTGFIPRGCSDATEEIGRATSWGLLQVMGETARFMGFQGWFPEMCTPAVGLYWGCNFLMRLRDRHLAAYGWPGVVAAYNAGSPRLSGNKFVNQEYVDKILVACGGVWPGKV